MIKSIINWILISNYRLVFINIMMAIFCHAWFGNNYLFGATIGLMILIIKLYIAFFVFKYINGSFLDDLKSCDIATIVYRYLLLIVPFLIAVIITIFALYLIFISDQKYSFNYIGGSFICFFEIIILATIATKIQDANGNIIEFLSD